MSASRIHLIVFDGFADWQTSLACHAAGRREDLHVCTTAVTPGVIRAASGLSITPNYTLDDIATHETALLLVPGGTLLEEREIPALTAVLQALHAADVPIGAIGAGTLALAYAGLLAGKRHTGNGSSWLKSHCAGYDAEAFYVAVPAVTDSGIVTAAGPAIIDFAHEILKALDIVEEPERRSWLRSLREGVPF